MKKIIARTLSSESRFPDTILLLLRFLVGITMMTHGVAKLLSFGELSATFPDPIGLGRFPLFAHDYWCGSRLLRLVDIRGIYSLGYLTLDIFHACRHFCRAWQRSVSSKRVTTALFRHIRGTLFYRRGTLRFGYPDFQALECKHPEYG